MCGLQVQPESVDPGGLRAQPALASSPADVFQERYTLPVIQELTDSAEEIC